MGIPREIEEIRKIFKMRLKRMSRKEKIKMALNLFRTRFELNLKIGVLLGLTGLIVSGYSFVLVFLNGFKVINYAGYMGPLLLTGIMLVVTGAVVSCWNIGKIR